VTGSLERLALAVQQPGFAGTSLPSSVLRLYEEGLGGLCLFDGNTSSGPEAVARLCAAVHEANPGAVVAVDEEGGDVTRLHSATGSPVLAAAALGVVDDVALTRAAGALVSVELAGCGIDVDFGPVADVNSDPDNPVIGTRSFGADPTRVAAHVAAWVTGLQATGVAACLKHFPGHGDTSEDSHLALPVVAAAREVLEARELTPFRAGVAAGARAVMTSHILLPALDPDRPATFSPTVIGLLRTDLGFDGAVVTDALDMAGASAGREIPEAAVLSMAAGADLLCLGADKDVALVRAVQAAIVAAVRGGRLGEARLAEAAARTATLRSRPVAVEAPDPAGQLAGARAALRVEGDLPDLTGALLARVDSPVSIAIGDVPWGLPTDVEASTGLAQDGRPLVVQARDAHRSPGVLAMLTDLAERTTVVLVDYGWPGPLDLPVTRVLTHGGSRPSYDAVAGLLRAHGWRP
jgi:beta-N-acetylhexosaminidase